MYLNFLSAFIHYYIIFSSVIKKEKKKKTGNETYRICILNCNWIGLNEFCFSYDFSVKILKIGLKSSGFDIKYWIKPQTNDPWKTYGRLKAYYEFCKLKLG